jgi:hypothetical protein
MSHHTIPIAVGIVALGAILAGCGGGSGPDAGTATVEGVLYLPADSSVVNVADVGGAAAREPEPAADCPVICTRDRDRRRLRSTTTDTQGRFRFEGLPRGESVTIEAELPGGEQVRTRLRLRNRTHRLSMHGQQ